VVQRREFCCAIPWMRVKSAHSKFGCAKRLSSPKKEESRVCTYLFDVKYEDVKDPLSQFQLTLATEGDTKKLIVSINRALSVNVQLSTERLDKAFAMWWPELHKRLSGISKPAGPAMPERPDSDKISEILTRVRALEGVLVSREISASTAAVAAIQKEIASLGTSDSDRRLKILSEFRELAETRRSELCYLSARADELRDANGSDSEVEEIRHRMASAQAELQAVEASINALKRLI